MNATKLSADLIASESRLNHAVFWTNWSVNEATEFKVEDESGIPLIVDRVYPRQEVRKLFGIKDRQLKRYINLLIEAVPDEFEYQPNTSCFDESQFKALLKIRRLFMAGMITPQIMDKLRVEGLKC